MTPLTVALALVTATAAPPQPAAPTPSEKLAKQLGPVAVDYLGRVARVEAFRVGEEVDPKNPPPGADRVAGRAAAGPSVPVPKERAAELVAALLADDTYFKSSSLGTKVGVGYRLWTDKGECVEFSCCLVKGNLRMAIKGADGKVSADRGVGGFRDAKNSPMRAIAASLFPDDKAVAAFAPKVP